MLPVVRKLILWRLNALERQLGQSVDYLRYMLRVAPGAFLKFARFAPIAAYRRALPKDAAHVARLVSAMHQDCGTCVQIEVKLALDDSLDPTLIRAMLDRDPTRLPDDLTDVYHFTQAVVEATYDEEPLRQKLIARYGETAFAELALTIATCQVFPITKRALGFAKSCSQAAIGPEAPAVATGA